MATVMALMVQGADPFGNHPGHVFAVEHIPGKEYFPAKIPKLSFCRDRENVAGLHPQLSSGIAGYDHDCGERW
jgi:hypothetical protein